MAKICDAFSVYFSLKLLNNFNVCLAATNNDEFLKCFRFYEYFICPLVQTYLLAACSKEIAEQFVSFKVLFCNALAEHLNKHGDQVSLPHMSSEMQQTLNNAIDTIALNVLKDYKKCFTQAISNAIHQLLDTQDFLSAVAKEFQSYCAVIMQNQNIKNGQYVIMKDFPFEKLSMLLDNVTICQRDLEAARIDLLKESLETDVLEIGKKMMSAGIFFRKYCALPLYEQCLGVECRALKIMEQGKQYEDTWIQCDTCARWYHMKLCLRMTAALIKAAIESPTYECPACKKLGTVKRVRVPAADNEEPKPKRQRKK